MTTTHKLESFDINNLDEFETIEFNRCVKSMSKTEALMCLINAVDGDPSQLSDELAEIAEYFFAE